MTSSYAPQSVFRGCRNCYSEDLFLFLWRLPMKQSQIEWRPQGMCQEFWMVIWQRHNMAAAKAVWGDRGLQKVILEDEALSPPVCEGDFPPQWERRMKAGWATCLQSDQKCYRNSMRLRAACTGWLHGFKNCSSPRQLGLGTFQIESPPGSPVTGSVEKLAKLTYLYQFHIVGRCRRF